MLGSLLSGPKIQGAWPFTFGSRPVTMESLSPRDASNEPDTGENWQ